MRHDLGVDLCFPYPPGDELRVLRAEVDDQDRVVHGFDLTERGARRKPGAARGQRFLPWCDVRDLPVADPGVPDTRSPIRFLLWIARNQWLTLLAGIAFGICWLVAQAAMPWAIGRGIELGVVDGDADAAVRWSLVVFGIGVVNRLQV